MPPDVSKAAEWADRGPTRCPEPHDLIRADPTEVRGAAQLDRVDGHRAEAVRTNQAVGPLRLHFKGGPKQRPPSADGTTALAWIMFVLLSSKYT